MFKWLASKYNIALEPSARAWHRWGSARTALVAMADCSGSGLLLTLARIFLELEGFCSHCYLLFILNKHLNSSLSRMSENFMSGHLNNKFRGVLFNFHS